MRIGDKIKIVRENKNLTQKELAEKSGITRESIGNYERNDRIPPSDILKSIAVALDTTVSVLVDEENIKNKSTVGENIRRIRKYRKLTLEELGSGIGLSMQTIGQYERGEREPNIKILKEIASNLGVTTNELIEEKRLSVGETIKKYRTNLGITQKQLSEKCSLSESSIKYYEAGTRKPKREALEKIAVALDISLNLLIENICYVHKQLKDYTTDELLAEIKRRIENTLG